MPLYEYECDACGERFELIQKFSDGPPAACAKCGKGPVHRQISSPAFQFKGSGWYITDYARKGTSPEGEGPKSEGPKSEGPKGEGSKGEGSKKGDAAAASSSGDSGGTSKETSSGTTPASSTPAKSSAS